MLRACWVFWAIILFTNVAYSQEQPKGVLDQIPKEFAPPSGIASVAKSESTIPVLSPEELATKKAKFKELEKEIRATFRDLFIAKEKFETSISEAETEQLQNQWLTLKTRGEEVFREMEALGVLVVANDAKNNLDIHDFLIDRFIDHAEEERFYSAERILEAIRTGNMYNPNLDQIACVVDFMNNKFDTMDQFAKKSKELNDKHREVIGAGPFQKEKWAHEVEFRNKEAAKNDLPQVLLQTSKGDVLIELYEDEAPNTVANFISLVEKGFYDGLIFHRVLKGFMAQGGDPKGDGTGGPGYAIPCECYAPNHRDHFIGSLSMAHAGKDTGGSQFYICSRPTPHLDGKHTVFGRVISGLENVDAFNRIDPEKLSGAENPDRIIKATVVRKRDHAYEPKTLPEPR